MERAEDEPLSIRNARGLLIEGDLFHKRSARSRFSAKQKLNERFVWVSDDLQTIMWCNGKSKNTAKAKMKKAILMDEVQSIMPHMTEPTHFEIITNDPKKSIVLRSVKREEWILRLRMLKDGTLNYRLNWGEEDVGTEISVYMEGKKKFQVGKIVGFDDSNDDEHEILFPGEEGGQEIRKSFDLQESTWRILRPSSENFHYAIASNERRERKALGDAPEIMRMERAAQLLDEGIDDTMASTLKNDERVSQRDEILQERLESLEQLNKESYEKQKSLQKTIEDLIGERARQLAIKNVEISVRGKSVKLGRGMPLGRHLVDLNYWNDDGQELPKEHGIIMKVDLHGLPEGVESETIEIILQSSQGRRLTLSPKLDKLQDSAGTIVADVPWVKFQGNGDDIAAWQSMEGGESIMVQVLVTQGKERTSSDKYEIYALAAPKVEDIFPCEGPSNANGQTLMIRGKNLCNAGKLRVILTSETNNQGGHSEFGGVMVDGAMTRYIDVDRASVKDGGTRASIGLPRLAHDTLTVQVQTFYGGKSDYSSANGSNTYKVIRDGALLKFFGGEKDPSFAFWRSLFSSNSSFVPARASVRLTLLVNQFLYFLGGQSVERKVQISNALFALFGAANGCLTLNVRDNTIRSPKKKITSAYDGFVYATKDMPEIIDCTKEHEHTFLFTTNFDKSEETRQHFATLWLSHSGLLFPGPDSKYYYEIEVLSNKPGEEFDREKPESWKLTKGTHKKGLGIGWATNAFTEPENVRKSDDKSNERFFKAGWDIDQHSVALDGANRAFWNGGYGTQEKSANSFYVKSQFPRSWEYEDRIICGIDMTEFASEKHIKYQFLHLAKNGKVVGFMEKTITHNNNLIRGAIPTISLYVGDQDDYLGAKVRVRLRPQFSFRDNEDDSVQKFKNFVPVADALDDGTAMASQFGRISKLFGTYSDAFIPKTENERAETIRQRASLACAMVPKLLSLVQKEKKDTRKWMLQLNLKSDNHEKKSEGAKVRVVNWFLGFSTNQEAVKHLTDSPWMSFCVYIPKTQKSSEHDNCFILKYICGVSTIQSGGKSSFKTSQLRTMNIIIQNSSSGIFCKSFGERVLYDEDGDGSSQSDDDNDDNSSESSDGDDSSDDESENGDVSSDDSEDENNQEISDLDSRYDVFAIKIGARPGLRNSDKSLEIQPWENVIYGRVVNRKFISPFYFVTLVDFVNAWKDRCEKIFQNKIKSLHRRDELERRNKEEYKLCTKSNKWAKKYIELKENIQKNRTNNQWDTYGLPITSFCTADLSCVMPAIWWNEREKRKKNGKEPRQTKRSKPRGLRPVQTEGAFVNQNFQPKSSQILPSECLPPAIDSRVEGRFIRDEFSKYLSRTIVSSNGKRGNMARFGQNRPQGPSVWPNKSKNVGGGMVSIAIPENRVLKITYEEENFANKEGEHRRTVEEIDKFDNKFIKTFGDFYKVRCVVLAGDKNDLPGIKAVSTKDFKRSSFFILKTEVPWSTIDKIMKEAPEKCGILCNIEHKPFGGFFSVQSRVMKDMYEKYASFCPHPSYVQRAKSTQVSLEKKSPSCIEWSKNSSSAWDFQLNVHVYEDATQKELTINLVSLDELEVDIVVKDENVSGIGEAIGYLFNNATEKIGNTCTFQRTLRTFENQKAYTCKTHCEGHRGRVFCAACWKNCHGTCEGSVESNSSSSYCDCGAEPNAKWNNKPRECKCINRLGLKFTYTETVPKDNSSQQSRNFPGKKLKVRYKVETVSKNTPQARINSKIMDALSNHETIEWKENNMTINISTALYPAKHWGFMFPWYGSEQRQNPKFRLVGWFTPKPKVSQFIGSRGKDGKIHYRDVVLSENELKTYRWCLPTTLPSSFTVIEEESFGNKKHGKSSNNQQEKFEMKALHSQVSEVNECLKFSEDNWDKYPCTVPIGQGMQGDGSSNGGNNKPDLEKMEKELSNYEKNLSGVFGDKKQLKTDLAEITKRVEEHSKFRETAKSIKSVREDLLKYYSGICNSEKEKIMVNAMPKCPAAKTILKDNILSDKEFKLLRTPSTFTQKESESDEEANFDEEKFVSDLREKGGLLEQKVKSMNDFVKKMEDSTSKLPQSELIQKINQRFLLYKKVEVDENKGVQNQEKQVLTHFKNSQRRELTGILRKQLRVLHDNCIKGLLKFSPENKDDEQLQPMEKRLRYLESFAKDSKHALKSISEELVLRVHSAFLKTLVGKGTSHGMKDDSDKGEKEDLVSDLENFEKSLNGYFFTLLNVFENFQDPTAEMEEKDRDRLEKRMANLEATKTKRITENHLDRLICISRWYALKYIHSFSEKINKSLSAIMKNIKSERSRLQRFEGEQKVLNNQNERDKNPILWILHFQSLDLTDFYVAIPHNSRFKDHFRKFIEYPCAKILNSYRDDLKYGTPRNTGKMLQSELARVGGMEIGNWFRIAGLENFGASAITTQSELTASEIIFDKKDATNTFLYPLEKSFWDATLPHIELNEYDEYAMVSTTPSAIVTMGDSEIMMQCHPPTISEIAGAIDRRMAYRNMRTREMNVKYLLGEVFSILDDDASGTLDQVEAKFAAEHISRVVSTNEGTDAVALQRQFKALGEGSKEMTKKRFVKIMYERTGIGRKIKDDYVEETKTTEHEVNVKGSEAYQKTIKSLRDLVVYARGEKEGKTGIIDMVLNGLFLPFYHLLRFQSDTDTSPFKNIWNIKAFESCYSKSTESYLQLGDKEHGQDDCTSQCSIKSCQRRTIDGLALLCWLLYTIIYYAAVFSPILYSSGDFHRTWFSPLEMWFPFFLCMIVALFGQVVFVEDWKHHLNATRYRTTTFTPLMEGDRSGTKESAHNLINELGKRTRTTERRFTLSKLLTEDNIMRVFNTVLVLLAFVMVCVCAWAWKPIRYFLPASLSEASLHLLADMIRYCIFMIGLGTFGSCFLFGKVKQRNLAESKSKFMECCNKFLQRNKGSRLVRSVKRFAGSVAIFIYAVLMIVNVVGQMISGGVMIIFAVDVSQSVDTLSQSLMNHNISIGDLRNISSGESVFEVEDATLTDLNRFFLCAYDRCCTDFSDSSTRQNYDYCQDLAFDHTKCNALPENIVTNSTCSSSSEFVEGLLNFSFERIYPVGVVFIVVGIIELMVLASTFFTISEKNHCATLKTTLKTTYVAMMEKETDGGETGDTDYLDLEIGQSMVEQTKMKRQRWKKWSKAFALLLAVVHACVPGFYRTIIGYHFFGKASEEFHMVMLHTSASIFFLYQVYGRLGVLLVEWFDFSNSLDRFSKLFDAIETRKIRLYDGKFTRLSPDIFDNVKVWDALRSYYLECKLPQTNGDGLPILGPTLALNLGLLSFLFIRVIFAGDLVVDVTTCMIIVDVASFSIYLILLMGVAVNLNDRFDSHASILSELSLEILEARAELADTGLELESRDPERSARLEALLATNMYLGQMKKVILDNTSPVRVFGIPLDKNLKNAVFGYMTTTLVAPLSVYLMENLKYITGEK
jgi:hypothetical protein